MVLSDTALHTAHIRAFHKSRWRVARHNLCNLRACNVSPGSSLLMPSSPGKGSLQIASIPNAFVPSISTSALPRECVYLQILTGCCNACTSTCLAELSASQVWMPSGTTLAFWEQQSFRKHNSHMAFAFACSLPCMHGKHQVCKYHSILQRNDSVLKYC